MATILLADDGSDIARSALTRGIELLGRSHSFHALSVVEPPRPPGAPLSPMDGAHITLPDPELEAKIENQVRSASAQELENLLDNLNIEARTTVETGEPAVVICEVASRIDADLIVMGSHGYGLFKRMLHGSVSSQVLQNAPCALLVVRDELPKPSE